MTYILQKKITCCVSFHCIVKYFVLILFFSFIPSEREAAYHNFVFKGPPPESLWGGAAPIAPLATPLTATLSLSIKSIPTLGYLCILIRMMRKK